MYEYKSEVQKISFKLFSASVNDSEVSELDKIINQQASEGWELVCHSFMGGSDNLKNGILLTFRKEK